MMPSRNNLKSIRPSRRGRGAVITAHAAEHYAPLLEALDAVRREATALGLPLSAVATLLTTEEPR